jgi:tRNA nucleotidyltransferase (CCA-adding enzyme)
VSASQGSGQAAGRGSAEGRGGDVVQALLGWPGGPQLLALAGAREDVALVGGAVRDLLSGCAPRELDVVVAHDAASVARELAERLGASTVVHERFGTAVVEWEAGRIDVAARRAETYAAPGALPDVRPGTAEEDLRRRDFTVNAIAVPLAGPHAGKPQGVEHALEDLDARRLRVLHEHSFLDDPTRLLRLARYSARLGFAVELHTAQLARAAVTAGALATVSRARVGAELRLALGEADAPAALVKLGELGVLAALDPRLGFDAALARAALDLLSAADAGAFGGARADVLLLAVLLASMTLGLGAEDALERHSEARQHADDHGEADMRALLDGLELPAAERDAAVAAATGAGALAAGLAAAKTRSQVYEAASRASPEGVALAGALGEQRLHLDGAAASARAWLGDVRHVRLQIAGEDLLAAGIPEGPEIGLRLHAALVRKLDGRLDGSGSEAELNAALEARV